jgi:serralysin
MSFHQYRINELYSNASGTVQFIELTVGNVNGESHWEGVTLSATSNGVSHSFSFPGDLPSSSTANTAVLIATQGFADLGLLTPNFIVPAGFLFTNGGTLNFGGADIVTYSALPTDEVLSINRSSTQASATPKNFAGVTASLPAPQMQTLSGTSGNDTLTGTAATDRLQGLEGNDALVSTVGGDTLDGGQGLDTAVYSLARSAYTLQRSGSGAFSVEKPNSAGTDALTSIERLQFSDSRLALDLDGHAGQTAKLLGAVFGAASVANKQFVGIGLSFLDAGTSYEQLAGMAMGAAGKTSHTDVVDLLWSNLVGTAPSPSQAAPIVALLDGGMTVGALTVLAADLDLNTNNISLIGLAQTGIEYSL